jgi:alkylation response protein AidB-like acyl-CoA dehydrogenase
MLFPLIQAFGAPISKLQSIQIKLAQMGMKIEASRLLTRQVRPLEYIFFTLIFGSAW